MKCLNIIVYYNNDKEVEEYIQDVYEIGKNMVDVFVVINSDIKNNAKNLLEKLQKKYMTLKFINFKENVGYLNSMLYVIKKINIEQYKYIILSNTDIRYLTDNFFDYLKQKNYRTEIGCVAPSIYSSLNGSFSNPHYLKRISKKKMYRLSFIFKYPILGRLYLNLSRKRSKKKAKELMSCFVYSPHGSYMIFTYEFIKKIKGYEYGVKLYSEESCIGELLLQENMKCYYDSNIKIEHFESTTTNKLNYKKRFKLWKESIDYIIKTFY